MTIKRRLLFANISVVFITFAVFLFNTYIVRLIFFGFGGLDWDDIKDFVEQYDDMHFIILFPAFSVYIIILIVINSFLSYSMTKRIIKPLEPLNEGVRHIKESNYTYRIDYQGNDEFRPVCDAFNKMAEKLETTTANRRELIAGISHDLRTPLTSIKVSIAGIKSGVASTVEQQQKYLSFIENQAANMEHIVDQLFLFSKLDMDEYQTEPRLVNCGTMIEDCIEELSGEYAQHGLTITAGAIPDGSFVNIDPILFRRVILNIIGNSAKYKTSDSGHLSINCVKTDNVTITFTDDGPGVEPPQLEKLFDVFYRSDQSRSDKSSGLGLPISAKIIAKMGGTVHAELPSAGGLSIVIQFPLAKEVNHA
jgi:signal transduction histidine kinase